MICVQSVSNCDLAPMTTADDGKPCLALQQQSQAHRLHHRQDQAEGVSNSAAPAEKQHCPYCCCLQVLASLEAERNYHHQMNFASTTSHLLANAQRDSPSKVAVETSTLGVTYQQQKRSHSTAKPPQVDTKLNKTESTSKTRLRLSASLNKLD